MQIFAIVVSLAFTVVAVAMTVKAVRSMLATIKIGQPALGRTDQPGQRTLVMLKETVLHTRMLQWTWVGILHWFAFAAFIVLSTAVAQAFFQLFDAEFAWPIIGHFFVYEWISEFIGLLGALAIIPLFIYRVIKRPSANGRQSRFFGSTMWQAYFVEAMVFLESSAIIFIRAAEYKHVDDAEAWHFPISHLISGMYPDSHSALENIIFFIAMVKIVSAMAWLMVISSNLTMGVAWHRFTAWFNIWFKRESSGRTALGNLKPLTSGGKAITLDDIDDLDEDSTLGVGSIQDFSWKGILDFTTCTECGRCQSQCPAWNTEKPLSPKLLMMGLREHAYATAGAPAADSEGQPEAAQRSLIGKTDHDSDGSGPEVTDWFYNPEGGDFVIDEDVLWSCTSCGACVQQCPVDIEHVDHIVDMRRYQVLVESNFPAELNQLFKGLENKGNPWNMSASARMDWAKGLDFEVKEVGKDLDSLESVDWLFWVGCAGAYEDRAKKTTRAVAELLDMAGVSFGVLGNGETCTGDPARRAGNEFVFQGLAQQNVETFKEFKVKKVVSTCAHCFNTLKNEYKEFGIELEVVHHTQLLNRLVREGKLTPVREGAGAAKRSITYHDPCYLGRHNQVYSPPRELLQILPGAEVKEMERNSEKSFCCGAGGARMWMEETIGERININRTKEAVGTGADQIAVGCPFCRVMLADGLTAEQANGGAREEVEVLDVAQMLLASVKGEAATRAPKPAARKSDAPAAKKDVATQAAPAAGDVTQTADTVTATEDVGPAAKASGGSSLFDTPADSAPAEKPAVSGGSLFDTPADSAPAEKPAASGGSLFDVEPDAPAAKPAASGGSLFDVEPDVPAAKPAAGGSAPAAEAAPAAKAEPAGDLGSSGSLFDISADEPAAPAAKAEPAAEQADATPDVAPDAAPDAAPAAKAEPAQDIDMSGSLFDIPATEPEAPAAKTAPVEEAVTEAVTEAPAAKTDAAPAEPAKVEPAQDIDMSGSLFDIPATEPEAPAAKTAPAEETAAKADAETDGGAAAQAPLSGAELSQAATDASPEAAESDPETIVDAEPEQAADSEPATPKAAENTPKQADINEAGSLFDL
ncbi:4Fe-4S dicluster domain-containing protein [Nocardioides sp. JQ2195]|uniref:(Fe-S)-binding protein n=1 Tax=Nocardioides sp. JQ2195 TaxID=2592334 RepID=UPI00143EC1F2|nr:(Fe-S)-binding protein [Nocardioides sp. JQ2195]QIX25353.1 4Fe-4S dicluster domain-containing protein [Nocardioides sp. JQ2195]